METILVTGGAGFIGSNFIPYFLDNNKDYYVINLDKLTYAGDLSNLREVEKSPSYKFIKGDICNRELIDFIFYEYDVRGVIHFAAESHVDNSIKGPEEFVKTNVMGTFNLLDAARCHWLDEPFKYKKGYEDCRFLHISTDEVYGTLGEEGYFTEETPYAPNSPYSSSKASSDMIVRSYFHTYGLNTLITNCSNNYGPKQHSEKLIPTIVRKALTGENIPIYGDGKNVRDWLFVTDHCRAIETVFLKGRLGETYNVGTRNERTNIELAEKICSILDSLKPLGEGKSYGEQISFVKDRPGHDRRYAIDPSKLENELEFRSTVNFEEGLQKTIKWYLNK